MKINHLLNIFVDYIKKYYLVLQIKTEIKHHKKKTFKKKVAVIWIKLQNMTSQEENTTHCLTFCCVHI